MVTNASEGTGAPWDFCIVWKDHLSKTVAVQCVKACGSRRLLRLASLSRGSYVFLALMPRHACVHNFDEFIKLFKLFVWVPAPCVVVSCFGNEETQVWLAEFRVFDFCGLLCCLFSVKLWQAMQSFLTYSGKSSARIQMLMCFSVPRDVFVFCFVH